MHPYRMGLGLIVILALACAGCRVAPLSGHGNGPAIASGSESDELGAPPSGEAVPGVASPPPSPPPVALSKRVYAAEPPAVPHVPPPYQPAPCVPSPCPPTPCDPCLPVCDPMVGPRPCFTCRPWYAGGSVSLLPNLGAAIEVGRVLVSNESVQWSAEAEFTWQFIDDSTFADDGNPRAGDWFQLQVGAKVISKPKTRRHLTGRGGLVWFHADGEPNIVEEEGHYGGIYLGFGYEADLTSTLTMGPEISGMLVMSEDGRVEVVPQFNWHVIWKF